MHRKLAYILLILSSFAWAQTTTTFGISSISGASGSTLTGTPTIYGSTLGDSCTTGTSTCSNCNVAAMTSGGVCTRAAEALCACATARISDTTLLSITITRPANVAGVPRLILSSQTAGANAIPGTASGDTVRTPWVELCDRLEDPGSCDLAGLSGNLTLRVFMDLDNDGIYDSNENSNQVEVQVKISSPDADQHALFGEYYTSGIGGFKPYAGDEKVYIDQIDKDPSFPNITGHNLKTERVRVFYSTTNITEATPASSSYEDLNVDTSGGISPVKVEGLTNGVRYFFRLGMVDQAGNIVLLYPDGTDNDCNNGLATCFWSAEPSEVLGMLSEDFNCFIASAAYGTSLEPKLKILREFRFKILLQNSWGRKFVFQYYKYGSMAARYIHNKPFLQTLTRAALWPVVGFSWLAVHWGLWPALLIALLTLSTLILLPWYGLRKCRSAH